MLFLSELAQLKKRLPEELQTPTKRKKTKKEVKKEEEESKGGAVKRKLV